MSENVSLLTAFIAGFISFISPCVLPLIPAYVSFISGVSLKELQTSHETRLMEKIIINMIMFIVGFSIVFIGLGATATYIGKFLEENLNILSKIGGVIVVIFGLHLMGVFRIGFLNYEVKFHQQSKPLGVVGSMLIGLAFAFGWTPCIGPVLAGILLVASTQETITQGILLLTFYSLGLGIPFFLAGLSINYFFKAFSNIKNHFHKIEVASGVLLVAIGILIFTNNLTVIAQYLQKWFPWLNLG
jgi:cytochrome c-type biogenesis protein